MKDGTYAQMMVVERGKRKKSADVYECGAVEQQIDYVGKHRVFSLLVEVPTGHVSLPLSCDASS